MEHLLKINSPPKKMTSLLSQKSHMGDVIIKYTI